MRPTRSIARRLARVLKSPIASILYLVAFLMFAAISPAFSQEDEGAAYRFGEGVGEWSGWAWEGLKNTGRGLTQGDPEDQSWADQEQERDRQQGIRPPPYDAQSRYKPTTPQEAEQLRKDLEYFDRRYSLAGARDVCLGWLPEDAPNECLAALQVFYTEEREEARRGQEYIENVMRARRLIP